MKDAIHPAYHQAAVHCQGCDRKFTVGSTADTITVELCSNCHPFYTGKQKLVDTAGRVDRFRARQATAKAKAVESKDETQSTAKPADDSLTPSTAQATPESRLAEMKQQLESKSDE